MAGGQSSALITVSKAKGWDPTEIPARGDQPAHSIANFDKDQALDPMTHRTTGTLPEGTPDTFSEASEPKYEAGGSRWNYPAHSDGNAPARRTSGADPTPGMPGA
jgi:hypothetical protein